ncbi:MAG: hypothetical protein LBN26_08935 [Christensenellaceae bacterium]|nr:hypothetical protein [Christensenellaceae bacterium]
MLMIACLFACGCAKDEVVIVDVTGGVSVESSELPAEGASAAARAQVTVRDTAAYVLSGAEGTMLYGAVAYENTGDAPVVLTDAEFTFTADGNAIIHVFTPVFAEQTVVLPGESSYVALWRAESGLAPGTEATLAAKLSCKPCEGARNALAVDRIFLAHNYPAFTTMTGRVTAERDCPLNLLYTAFYDDAGGLLGVWYFTEGAQLMAGEALPFTQHMKSLPIEGLAEQTAQVRAFGVGIQY